MPQLTEPELEYRKTSPVWARKRRQAELDAERGRADREQREREQAKLLAALRPPEPTSEQLEARAAAAEQAKDYANRRRLLRNDLETECRQLDAAMTAAVGALDVSAYAEAHGRRAALLDMLVRLDTDSRQAARLAPVHVMQVAQR